MPTYDYICTACSHNWEEIQRITADPLEACPKCGKNTARRQITGGNFILKGGGWYADAYSSKPATKDGGGDAKPDAAGDPKTETKTDAKPEAKPEKSETKTEAAPKPAPKTETKPGGTST